MLILVTNINIRASTLHQIKTTYIHIYEKISTAFYTNT